MRRECLDHIIVNERQLRRVLREYVARYKWSVVAPFIGPGDFHQTASPQRSA